ncbi:MAG: hypothetical protein RPS47_14620 [Colwellia sp.]
MSSIELNYIATVEGVLHFNAVVDGNYIEVDLVDGVAIDVNTGLRPVLERRTMYTLLAAMLYVDCDLPKPYGIGGGRIQMKERYGVWGGSESAEEMEGYKIAMKTVADFTGISST